MNYFSKSSLITWLCSCLLFGLQAVVCYAQVAQFQIVEKHADRVRVEVQVKWQNSLSESLEKARANPTTTSSNTLALLQALQTVTDGTMIANESVALNAAVAPTLQVVSSEFDEVPFEANIQALPASAASELAKPLAQMQRIGFERKQPIGTLAVRTITYDADTQTLRRYRKVVVDVVFGQVPLLKTAETSTNPHLLVANSVLSTGKWFRIPITEEGVYKIDAVYLQALGVTSTDFGKLQIFGNGGKMLPALNSTTRIPDLQSNSVYAASDGLYFYANAPKGWTYNTSAKRWEHYLNVFSNENAVFLRVDEAATNPVKAAAAPTASTFTPVTTIDGRWFAEEDLDNKSESDVVEEGSGLDWFGKQFSPTITQTIVDQTFEGMTNGTVQYRSRVAVYSSPSVAVRFESNGATLASYDAVEVYVSNQGEDGIPEITSFTNAAASGIKQTIQLKMGSGINDPKGWIDWIEAIYPQTLTGTSNFLRFHTPANTNGVQMGGMEMVLSGFTSTPLVWDITNPNAITQLAVTESSGTYRVRLVVEGNTPRELVAFAPNSTLIKKPSAGKAVANQNLHAIKQIPEFVLVTPTEFKTQSEELAAYRRAQGMTVEVLDINQIFNEFSGGVVDMRAIRDYFKFLYDKDATKFQYALLVGDGTYDYRGIAKGTNKNWLPVYETDESLVKMITYTSDDYFGLLDDNEGEWEWYGDGAVGTELVDIGIGRIPAQSATEVADVVKKIKLYENPSSYGAWRTRYTWVADDQYPRNEYDLHTSNADYIARFTKTIAPNLNQQKIYAISYPHVVVLAGRKVPEAHADILRSMNDGTLVWNYSGHGGWKALADEGLLLLEDITSLENLNTLPIMVTATCSFGHWDYANKQSSGELAVLNAKGGAIAVFTTVRIVVTSENTFTLNPGLNRQLNTYLVTRDANGLPRRLGDVLRLTKNTDAGSQGNNRKFNLFGDPTMRIGLPTEKTVVDKVNGKDAVANDVPLRALEKMTLEGHIEKANGTVNTSFNGSVEVTVFDALRYVNIDPEQVNFITDGRYEIQNDLIYRGKVDVKQGKWNMTFVVPKDISYANRNGKIALYASSTQTDAIGSTEKIIVGGTSPNAIVDTKSPIVRAFLNDTTFVSGSLTTKQPELILQLFDDNGLNTVGTGVGHELLLVIDDDERNAVDLGARYQAAANSFQKGEVRYTLPEQTDGSHTLKVKAWDIANNSGTVALDYYVSGSANLTIRNVYNYPNPTRGDTRFVFEHNQTAGTQGKVTIKIYTINGRLIKVLHPEDTMPSGVFNPNFVQVRWDGRDDDMDVLATGTYLYKVRVEVPSADGKETQVAEKIEKLVIIR